jgi:hypothetical protein
MTMHHVAVMVVDARLGSSAPCRLFPPAPSASASSRVPHSPACSLSTRSAPTPACHGRHGRRHAAVVISPFQCLSSRAVQPYMCARVHGVFSATSRCQKHRPRPPPLAWPPLDYSRTWPGGHTSLLAALWLARDAPRHRQCAPPLNRRRYESSSPRRRHHAARAHLLVARWPWATSGWATAAQWCAWTSFHSATIARHRSIAPTGRPGQPRRPLFFPAV